MTSWAVPLPCIFAVMAAAASAMTLESCWADAPACCIMSS